MSEPTDFGRGTGHTTRQLLQLRKNGVFIVHTDAMKSHARAIAGQLGRPDITVMGLWELGPNAEKLRGMNPWRVELDHAVYDTRERELVRLIDMVDKFTARRAYVWHPE